jgi:L-glyceraldehyde 3-phosphate reductase
MEETLGALDTLVKQGKALYAGVSSYSGVQFQQARAIVERERMAPILIHQPYFNLLARKVETDLLPHTVAAGVGVIAFCPLASGLLTDKFLDGEVPADSRAARAWARHWVVATPPAERRRILGGLSELAGSRGQSLAQMSLAWLLHLRGVTSTLIGASRIEQIEDNVRSLTKLEFGPDELRRIDELTRTATQP